MRTLQVKMSGRDIGKRENQHNFKLLGCFDQRNGTQLFKYTPHSYERVLNFEVCPKSLFVGSDLDTLLLNQKTSIHQAVVKMNELLCGRINSVYYYRAMLVGSDPTWITRKLLTLQLVPLLSMGLNL